MMEDYVRIIDYMGYFGLIMMGIGFVVELFRFVMF